MSRDRPILPENFAQSTKHSWLIAVACRDLVMLGATAWLYATYQFYYWAVAYGGHCYWIWAACDVITLRHIYVCKPTFWRSLLTQHAFYSTRTLRDAGMGVHDGGSSPCRLREGATGAQAPWRNSIIRRHTIRPVLAGTVPVSRLCPGVPVSQRKSPGYAFSQAA